VPALVAVHRPEVLAAGESTARLATAAPTVLDCDVACWYAMLPPAASRDPQHEAHRGRPTSEAPPCRPAPGGPPTQSRALP